LPPFHFPERHSSPVGRETVRGPWSARARRRNSSAVGVLQSRVDLLSGATPVKNHRWVLMLLLLALPALSRAAPPAGHFEAAPADQTVADVNRKSVGCLGCHERTDALSMHDNPAVKLGCTDCHGGDASVIPPRNLPRMELEYARLRDLAHVLP